MAGSARTEHSQPQQDPTGCNWHISTSTPGVGKPCPPSGHSKCLCPGPVPLLSHSTSRPCPIRGAVPAPCICCSPATRNLWLQDLFPVLPGAWQSSGVMKSQNRTKIKHKTMWKTQKSPRPAHQELKNCCGWIYCQGNYHIQEDVNSKLPGAPWSWI